MSEPTWHDTGARTERDTCGLDDCDKPHKARGMCGMHYKRWKKWGDPRRTFPANAAPCSVAGCPNPHNARGYCSSHYHRLRRHGDPLGGIETARAVGHLRREPETLDFAPIVDYVMQRGGPSAVFAAVGLEISTHRLGKAYERARARGRVSVDMADHLIIALFGVHPSFIYGEAWWVEVDDAEEAAA